MKNSEIELSECSCKKVICPPRNFCPKCGNKMEIININNKGTVYSFTTLFSVPKGFSSPLKLVMVEFDNKVKILCEFRGKREIEIGDSGYVIKNETSYEFKIS